jgi:regulatory protein YycH of two-component signal transduction system YycFG
MKIHFLISLFTKHKVYIDEESITIQGKKIVTQSIKIEDVCHVIFDQGTITRYGGGTPCSITLFDSDYNKSVIIENPSFFMICELQKRCKNAKFKFNNYKWYIIGCCISTAASIAFCLFIHLAPTYS